MMYYRCFHGTAPLYLVRNCREANWWRSQAVVAFSGNMTGKATYKNDMWRQIFAVAGPCVWNGLPIVSYSGKSIDPWVKWVVGHKTSAMGQSE